LETLRYRFLETLRFEVLRIGVAWGCDKEFFQIFGHKTAAKYLKEKMQLIATT